MIISMRLLLLPLALATTTLFISSCSNIQNTDDKKAVAVENTNESLEGEIQEQDAQFLVMAAEINLKEIQLGQLAQEKSETSDIKELGKMMEDAHAKSFNDLEVLAQSKMIEIPIAPTDEAQDACNALNEKTGNNFDKAYSDVLVASHKDAIEKFEKASKDCNDSEIKNWVIATLPALRTHLNSSIASQKKYSKL